MQLILKCIYLIVFHFAVEQEAAVLEGLSEQIQFMTDFEEQPLCDKEALMKSGSCVYPASKLFIGMKKCDWPYAH
jgi:hypothetical protein